MIRVGKNQPLTPDTEYYYRLQCAGDATLGSFRTARVKSGTKAVRLSRKAPASVASMLVEYSYEYDRDTDALTAPATMAGDCVSQSCTVEIEAEASRVLYYRFSDRDAGGNVLRRSTVHTTVPR